MSSFSYRNVSFFKFTQDVLRERLKKPDHKKIGVFKAFFDKIVLLSINQEHLYEKTKTPKKNYTRNKKKINIQATYLKAGGER